MTASYSRASIALHWAMAALLGAAWILGDLLEELGRGPARTTAQGWHVLLGLGAAALLMARIAARLRHGGPSPEAGPGWERSLARAAHGLLYALMTLLPALGLGILLTGRRPFPVLGLFEIPAAWPAPGLHAALEGAHAAAAKLALGLVALHLAATAWHALVRRDGVAARMLPFLGRPAAARPR
jgi:cytochrome b561